MKARLAFVLGMTALGCLALTDCGGEQADTSGTYSNGGTAPVLGSPPSVLDTQEVLALTNKSSETAQPFAVDGGAVSDDETSEPISVNGT